METPANPFIRKRPSKCIELDDGAVVHLTKCGPRQGYRFKAEMLKKWSALWFLLADDIRDGKGNKVPRHAVLTSKVWLIAFLEQFVQQLGERDPEGILHLAAELVAGRATFELDGQKVDFSGTADEVLEQFDRCFSDSYEMLAFCALAFEFILGPTALAKATFEALARKKSGQSDTPASGSTELQTSKQLEPATE